MTLHAVTALVERRREIMREQAYLQQELRSCEEALGHIDATIQLLDPEFDISNFKPKKACVEDELFRPGETPLLALDIIRESGKPLSTTDITKAMLVKKGMPRLNPRQFEALNRKLNACLNTKFRQGVLRKCGRIQGANRAVIWELIG